MMDVTIPFKAKNENYFDIDTKEIEITGSFNNENILSGTISNFNAKSRSETSDTISLSQVEGISTGTAATLAATCSSPSNTWTIEYDTKITLQTGGISFSFPTSIDMPCVAVSSSGNPSDFECEGQTPV
eukprot:CAMPEP_0167762718 /NCGR_PEP_ID=MMETSP0110_2-20121227/12940_1 /TAXON_ID=629695 /ORGANISM="Gymnochlora sp., Strain CCMP2014" /LENGTH=128 /DNA_ID=CAMNT_0007649657 /DNA_START=165 /DNA_END=551 /DNA_ORIENTATION=+